MVHSTQYYVSCERAYGHWERYGSHNPVLQPQTHPDKNYLEIQGECCGSCAFAFELKLKGLYLARKALDPARACVQQQDFVPPPEPSQDELKQAGSVHCKELYDPVTPVLLRMAHELETEKLEKALTSYTEKEGKAPYVIPCSCGSKKGLSCICLFALLRDQPAFIQTKKDQGQQILIGPPVQKETKKEKEQENPKKKRKGSAKD